MSHRIRMRMKCSAATVSGQSVAVSMGTSGVKERNENQSFSDFKAGDPNAILSFAITNPSALASIQADKYYTITIEPCET